MIASLYLGDVVVIPGGKAVGPGVYVDLREQSFHAVEGWRIEEPSPGVFSLCREGMPVPVVVGGCSYSVTVVDNSEVPTVAAQKPERVKRGKR